MVKEQLITDHYSIYNSDCVYVMQSLPSESIDFSIYSPPFAGLYNYSSSENDHSNCESKEQFLQAYEFVVKEISRMTKPGRLTAVHVTNIKDSKTEDMWNLPAEVIKLHQKYGFTWKDEVTIWKEPLKVRMRTMVRSLMHKLIIEDSTQCFTAMPDKLLVFRKNGENAVPVTHPLGIGLNEYFGDTPFLEDHKELYGNYQEFRKKWMAFDGDPRTNKLSHLTWQRYASSVWDDVRINNVLEYKESKDEDDEKHVHPLQLDVIFRAVELWTNPGEVVFTPYMGVGSEVYGPVRLGRKAIGVELKESYFKQAVKNLKECSPVFNVSNQLQIF